MVLGVVERDELAAAQRQRIGERLRLGARRRRPAPRRPPCFAAAPARVCAASVAWSSASQTSLISSLRLRPVDLFQRRDEFRHDRRLPDRARPAPNRPAGRRPARPAFRASAAARRMRSAAKRRPTQARKKNEKKKCRASHVSLGATHNAAGNATSSAPTTDPCHALATMRAERSGKRSKRSEVARSARQLPHTRKERSAQRPGRCDLQPPGNPRMLGDQPAQMTYSDPVGHDQIARRAVLLGKLERNVPGASAQERDGKFVGNDQSLGIDERDMADADLVAERPGKSLLRRPALTPAARSGNPCRSGQPARQGRRHRRATQARRRNTGSHSSSSGNR